MEHTYDFVRRNELMEEIQNANCTCVNGKERKQNEPTPIAAVVGPTNSGSAVLVASLLQVVGIPVISHSATSNELSSPQYRHFFFVLLLQTDSRRVPWQISYNISIGAT